MTTKALSAKDINALRVLLNKASKPPPMTRQQRDDKRRAERAAYKALVLNWATQHWDERYAALQAICPTGCPELGIGFRPTEFSKTLAAQYERRNRNKVTTMTTPTDDTYGNNDVTRAKLGIPLAGEGFKAPKTIKPVEVTKAADDHDGTSANLVGHTTLPCGTVVKNYA